MLIKNIKSVTSLLFANGHLPLITLPTRITTGSATLIYMITSSHPHEETKSFIVTLSLSDHLGTFITFPTNAPQKTPKEVNFIIFNNEAKYKFCDLMCKENYDTLYEETNVNSAFESFFKTHD